LVEPRVPNPSTGWHIPERLPLPINPTNTLIIPGTENRGRSGVLWGVLAFRTRSLLFGLLQHALLGIALDYFLCYWC